MNQPDVMVECRVEAVDGNRVIVLKAMEYGMVAMVSISATFEHDAEDFTNVLERFISHIPELAFEAIKRDMERLGY